MAIQSRDYSLVVLCVAVAATARLPLLPYMDGHDPFITFFPAIVAAAWIAGWGGGLLAIALSALLTIYFFIAPEHHFALDTTEDQVSFVVFLAVGLGVSAISQSQRRLHLQTKEAFVREALLNRLSLAIRQSTNVHEVRQIAVEMLGITLDADRCLSILIDESEDRAKIVNEWHGPDLPPVRGTLRLSSIDADLKGLFAEGRSQIVEEVETSAISSDQRALFQRLGIKACLHVPLLDNGVVVEVLGIYDLRGSRRWRPSEIMLLENAASQVWAVAETARLLSQAQENAAREALVSRIGQSLLATLDPEVIQWRAACLLGEALGVDRCFFVTYDFAADVLCRGEDWHRPDLPSIMGEYPASQQRFLLDELFTNGTAVIRDVRESLSHAAAAIEEEAGQRASLIVPLYDKDELVAALVAGMVDAPRNWTPEEVALIEEVAVLTRTALASARVNQREQRISDQLQQALHPVIPPFAPGLRLAHYYRPALKEAEVGGDFVDCFSLADGSTTLIVGDLSGKGLQAAAQVATVRNMLRYALYNGRTLSGPITRLNQTLAKNRLLVGFATLFVGCFDATSKTLRYVNCGQDPALVLRAGSEATETLLPTGAIMGAFPDSEYEEGTIRLEPGDVLAIFTDGLTEAGPDRATMLGMPGMTRLLREQHGENDARAIVNRLIEAVDIYSRDGIRDDVCLLVAVVE